MEHNHTPKPWTVHDAPNQHVGDFPCVTVLAPARNNYFQAVAFCVADSRDVDAALIAAAPDLLAALDDVMGWYSSTGVSALMRDEGETSEYHRTLNAANAALRKARGEA